MNENKFYDLITLHEQVEALSNAISCLEKWELLKNEVEILNFRKKIENEIMCLENELF